MAYRATKVSTDPITYFLQSTDAGPYLRVSDIVLRANLDPREIFSGLIRFATNSQWSHSALLYLLNDPPQGFDNTFLVEAMTTGVRVASWRNEVLPIEKFTVGIRRVPLDWYIEPPQETAHRNPDDPEDVHGIAYLRHVRGMAIDQINNLYSQDVIDELTALYVERIAERYNIPGLAQVAKQAASWFGKRDNQGNPDESVMRFICSGLVQYSFFAALHRRIMNTIDVPGQQDAAQSNLSNLNRVVFRVDPDGVIPDYIQQVQSGKLKISDPIPSSVLNFLKTTTPADFNNSSNMVWRYIIRNGVVWQLDAVPDGYVAQSNDEATVLKMIQAEHRK